MKIQRVRAIGLRGATPEGGWSNELNEDTCVHTLIEILTDEGVVGWGSVFTSAELVRASLAVLEPLYAGASAIEPERTSEMLHQQTFWQGRGGAITHTISGIDIALWDILGQVTGQPVGRLLGGRYRDRVLPYASILMDEPRPLAERIQRVRAAGFQAIKIGWGPFGRVSAVMDEQIVRTAREIAGPDVRLMVDAGGSDAFWRGTLKWARRTADMLATYDVFWFEEALAPDAFDDYVLLRQSSPIAIASGETLTRRQSFTPWIDGGAFDIVQPDVTKVGGISESRRIAWRARENGIRYIPHGWNTGVGLAADLQLASAIDDTDLVEYIIGSPYVDDIVDGGWHIDEQGFLRIPDSPGLGITLDMDALAHFTDVPLKT